MLDRVYIHGEPKTGTQRGIALNSGDTTIVNSYISDIKAIGQDSQAICGWNGPGPYRIENNYLEAAGENVMFGGATPTIQNLVPSNITIRRNHFSKNLAWQERARDDAGGDGHGGQLGSLAAGTYAYRVVAYAACGNSHDLHVDGVGRGQGDGHGVQVGEPDLEERRPGATSYRVYGRTAGNAEHVLDRRPRPRSSTPAPPARPARCRRRPARGGWSRTCSR